MTSFRQKFVRRGWHALLLAPLVVGQGCTELTETPHDALTPDNAFTTEAELLAGVAAVYANLRPVEWVGYITLQDLTTDVSIVPTRGSDWYDNGRWLELHRQTWTASSGSTLDDLNGAWNNMFSGIAKSNLMIEVIEKAKPPNGARTLGELRTLRAWFYYMLQDFFGGAPPLVTSTKLERSPSSTRADLFKFIETELTQSAADLPERWPADGYGRITKGAANAILASLYINAGVFSKNSGVSHNSYNSCAGVTVSGGRGACQAAIDAANAVINSGVYSLSTNWADNFGHGNSASPENIFVIVYTAEGQGLGGNWPFRTLHYNQLSSGWGGPWNGFATLAETYRAFDATDVRRGMWLEGPQRSFENGQPVNDRSGAPLIFTAEIPDADKASEAHGVRFNKFPPLPSARTGNGMPNDFPFFRLSEMYLIRAEARNELDNLAGAIADLAFVHNMRNPGNPIAGLTTKAQVRDAILRERLLEFAGEGKRRTDLIRHGKFLNRWSTTMLGGKQDQTGKPHLILFPVPVTQLGSNPGLRQNPGY